MDIDGLSRNFLIELGNMYEPGPGTFSVGLGSSCFEEKENFGGQWLICDFSIA